MLSKCPCRISQETNPAELDEGKEEWDLLPADALVPPGAKQGLGIHSALPHGFKHAG